MYTAVQISQAPCLVLGSSHQSVSHSCSEVSSLWSRKMCSGGQQRFWLPLKFITVLFIPTNKTSQIEWILISSFSVKFINAHHSVPPRQINWRDWYHYLSHSWLSALCLLMALVLWRSQEPSQLSLTQRLRSSAQNSALTTFIFIPFVMLPSSGMDHITICFNLRPVTRLPATYSRHTAQHTTDTVVS